MLLGTDTEAAVETLSFLGKVAMSGLPREILKWIQSLDLSFSIKNVKRDFANGFLVAEIFNRYYQSDVQCQMHSYDNGTSLRKKKGNWDLLHRFLDKHGIPISTKETEPVIHCKDGAAVQLVCKVYNILTGKTVRMPPPLPPDEEVPAFARPTASAMVKSAIRSPKMLVSGDQKQAGVEAQKTLERQRMERRAEMEQSRQALGQSLNRSLNASGPAPPQPVHRGPSRPVQKDGADLNSSNVDFVKEVRVKQVDDLALSRNSHQPADQLSARGNAPSDQNSPPNSHRSARRSARGNPKAVSSSAAPRTPPPPSRSAIQILDECVASALSTEDRKLLALPAEDDHGAFTALCSLDEWDDQDTASLYKKGFKAIESPVVLQELAQACLADPKAYWLLSSALAAVVNAAPYPSVPVFSAASLFCALGSALKGLEHYTPLLLFADFPLPRLSTALIRSAKKRPGVIRIMGAHCDDDPVEQIKAIKALKGVFDSVGDRDDVFLDCLTIFLSDSDPDSLSDELATLYLRYARKGLSEAPEVQASALGILVELALHPKVDGVGRVLGLFDVLTALGTSPSPSVSAEVRGHVARVCGSLLSSMEVSHEDAQKVYDLVQRILHDNASPQTLHMGLTDLAPCIAAHHVMRRLWLQLLLQKDDVRGTVLGLVDGSDLPASIQHMVPVYQMWTPVIVAEAIDEHLTATTPENMSAGHVELLSACLAQMDHFPPEEVERWQTVFEHVKHYLLVELMDEELTHMVVDLLRHFARDDAMQEAVISLFEPPADGGHPLFFGILKLVFSDGGDDKTVCRQAVASFLRSITTRQSPYVEYVAVLLKNFAQAQPEVFETQPDLQAILERAESGGDTLAPEEQEFSPLRRRHHSDDDTKDSYDDADGDGDESEEYEQNDEDGHGGGSIQVHKAIDLDAIEPEPEEDDSFNV